MTARSARVMIFNPMCALKDARAELEIAEDDLCCRDMEVQIRRLASELHFRYYGPMTDVRKQALFMRFTTLKVSIPRRWNGSTGGPIMTAMLDDAMRKFGFDPAVIRPEIKKKKRWFSNSYYYKITFFTYKGDDG